MKQKKILPYAIGLLIVAIILLVVGKKAGWFGNDFSISVATETVESKTITELITANGKIQPETEVKISPDVSGEIIELYVEEGDQVIQGDPLCIIKPDMYISALNRAEAALNSSKARQAQAEAQQIERELAFKRSKQLFEGGAIAVSEFETAEAAYKVAEAEVRAAQFSVKSAEASVSEAKEQLTKTRIFAPISGTISALNVEKGERVVGTSMMVGTEMMVVANLDKMEVQVEVNENDIVKVAKYDTTLVEVDAYLQRKFIGIVTEIANSASVSGASTDQVTNFDVKVFLLSESYVDLVDSTSGNIYPFRPGMSATVDIQTETRENVISVPISAVTTRVKIEGGGTKEVEDKVEDENATEDDSEEEVVGREEKQEVVFVLKDDRVRKVEVKTGIQDNNSIEILEGLTEGDEVVIAPYNAINKSLKDSMQVKKVTEEELFNVKK
ncbi:MAG: efflux RND transporter periplasmic adaptor subunit [Prolixibacteraceae bacterium]|jgi:HlyD family secretion protein|nr:efflux RND transporter periplasmic adaptor subunit [Prolixibacteraceae bacterium]MBT6007410.1 efflux RND transporter periplasmic adaptor subunit [Prolixibacteraceae bacterium]MBT6764088.1 efflux RND transporter periplasmic adaptor subunit [Prolixibacteraceae bacterium]MBT6997547.1 efflux RND transporter periplasmic adaptor subunit [Prolixibacteraceae bacterium]MBT7394559.1 efflux RND transporter periplasmic adaptor subunit [Prolixibacteraceae bacterium]